MKLIIGGYAQGKLRAVCESVPEKKKIIWDGTLWESSVGNGEQLIINHFHEWVKTCLKDGIHMEQELKRLLEQYPECIIIGDEIGNGIVPMDAFEREYREVYGRVLCNLAEQAEEVDRVLCGLRQNIKSKSL